ncbi:MAG: hypothetical protein CMB80_04840 [Flammeovirgaceae bacterium]|nr:hypothetical protein [Flammeovirgaceae bacterium]
MKEAIQSTAEQFDGEMYFKDRYHGTAGNDDPTRHPKIINLLKKLNLSKDFTLIDLGCGKAGVLNKISVEFPNATVCGVDVNRFKHIKDWNDPTKQPWATWNLSGNFYQLDFVELLNKDFKCDVAIMLNLFHSPGTFGLMSDGEAFTDGHDHTNHPKAIRFLKKLEEKMSSRFTYWVTQLNAHQYTSYANGTGHYSDISAKVIHESDALQVSQGFHHVNVIPEFVAIHLGDK